MNPFQKLYHWLSSELYLYFALRPMLAQIGIVFDFAAWTRAVTLRDVEAVQDSVSQLADIVTKEILSKDDQRQLRFMTFFTYGYSLWLVHSKRVFAPSKTLVDMLMLTDLPSYKIGEIKYVFDSFAIQLAKPIVSETGTKHSLILVSFEEDAISMISINEKLFENFSPLKKELLAELMRVFNDTSLELPARNEAAKKIEDHLWSWRDGLSPMSNYTFVTQRDMTYVESIQAYSDADSGGWTDVLKLVIGLNLYLQSDGRTGKGHGRVLKPELSIETNDDAPIYDAELVDLGVGTKDFDARLLEVLEQVSQGKVLTGVHIRTGHWRRYKEGVLANHPHGLERWIKPTLVCGSGVINNEELTLHFRGLVQKVELSESAPA